MEALYGVWRRLRAEGLAELFLSLGYSQIDVTRVMLLQYLTPSGCTFDPAGVLYPAVALTEHGSITRTLSLVLDADPVSTLYGGRAMQESAKFNKGPGTLVWRRKFLHNGVYHTLKLTRSVVTDVKGQRIMTCAYESTNEITKARETAHAWFIHVDQQPPPKTPSYFPLWTWGKDKDVSPAERALTFSLSPALIGRAVAEASSRAALTREPPPKMFIQQVLQCERLDLKAAQSAMLANDPRASIAPSSSSSSSSSRTSKSSSISSSSSGSRPPPPVFSADELDPDCDPAPWTVIADALHLDPRKALLRTLEKDAVRLSAAEGHATSFLPNRLENAAPPGSVGPSRLLLQPARSFRYRYIPVSTLQQSGDYPSEVAFSVLRDFVVLQGDGSSVSSRGAGWQYARDFGCPAEEWVAEAGMLKLPAGEGVVRRRVWLRVLVPQSDYVRADVLLARSLRDYSDRRRGTIKSASLDLFVSSTLTSSWQPCLASFDDTQLTLTLAAASSSAPPRLVALKGLTLRKLQIDTAAYTPRLPSDQRCEIELVPRDLAAMADPSKKPKQAPTLLRFSNQEERAEWLGALGHQIVLLGEGGVGCYDECPLLHPSPLMHGELFIQVEVNILAEMRADALREESAKRAAEATEARAKRFSFRRGSAADGVSRMSAADASGAAASAAAQLAADVAADSPLPPTSAAAPSAMLPPPPPSAAADATGGAKQHAWQLRRFLLFDEFLESHHCNDDSAGHGHAPWKIALTDFSYHETAEDGLGFVLKSADRVLTLRATSFEGRAEWREALRRVLRARSFNALRSDFCDDPDALLAADASSQAARRAFRGLSYAEDLVLAVRNNHVEESAEVPKGGKASVSQAKRLAERADDIAKGRKRGDVTLVTEHEVVVRRRQELENERLSARLRRLAVSIGLLRGPDKPPPLIVTGEVTMAMNKIGLKTNKFFEGVWMFKRNRGERLFRKRVCWLDPDSHAFLWAKRADRRVGKPMILFPSVAADLNTHDGPLSWTLRGGGFDLELVIMEQVVPALENEIFSPQLWVDAVRVLKKRDFGMGR